MIKNLKSHELFKTIIADGEQLFKRIKFKPTDLELPKETDFDEFEYYIHESGFSLMYFIKWCEQLELSLSLLNNFQYKDNISRADHFIYNVENYMIRVMSIYDKLLQCTNSIYHLCNHDEIVTHETIINNIKVSRTQIKKQLKTIRKFLMSSFGQQRNILIHQYSYRDKELRGIEIMYSHNFENYDEKPKKRLKALRGKHLSKAIKNKAKLFKDTNNKLYDLITPIFDSLLVEYKKQKKRLKSFVYG
ncbi:MAG: Cthe_2314 family HEPN domain-containing protein [Candidatus Thorarchaeota archaeon]